MTGIERLHKLIADIDVSADPKLWDILRCGTEGDWGCEERDCKTLGSTLAAIADQIEREQGEHVSRMRVLAVVTDMERHVSGVEGAEDSPVARWARELRRALKSDVSMSAYDLLSADEREAIAWVRYHGGRDEVRMELDNLRGATKETCARLGVDHTGDLTADAQGIWRAIDRLKSLLGDSVPRAAYERHLARRQRQIDESHAALRRRNQRIEELGNLVGDLATENAELRRRAMPEGCEWPRYDSGEPVGFGDVVSDVEVRSVVFRDGGILLSDCTSVPGWGTWRSYKEPIKRPAVPAADGEPLEVGQTVWHVSNGIELTVVGLINHGEKQVVKLRLSDDGSFTALNPDQLTHRAPVLAADGRPLREGETVWLTDGSERHVVLSTEEDGIGSIVTEVQAPGAVKVHISPSRLTHQRPDSWERIEEDAGCTATKYNERRGTIFTTKQQVARDLVRRCRALAERERGE